jgi:hypothetical protein
MRPSVLLALALLAATPARAARSPDGRLRWEEGDPAVTVVKRGGFAARGQHVPLPTLEKGARRRVVFAPAGDFFAVLDQVSDSIGLHGESPRGPRGAVALVTGAALRLMNLRGRVLWTRRLPETYSVGADGGSGPLTLGSDGTTALLMRDADPYTKAKPLVVVHDPKGREVLRLDYTVWSRVDEMLLSSDGRWLAVRGIGRDAERDAWGASLGHYRLEDGDRRVTPAAAASGARTLRGFDRDGRVCCLSERKELAAYAHDGARTVFTPDEAEDVFGAAP